MYLPAHFEETRTEALHALIVAHPLGTLVTLGSDGLTANHIPFLIDASDGPHGTLIGHVARNNALWHDHAGQVEVLVIFQGASAGPLHRGAAAGLPAGRGPDGQRVRSAASQPEPSATDCSAHSPTSPPASSTAMSRCPACRAYSCSTWKRIQAKSPARRRSGGLSVTPMFHNRIARFRSSETSFLVPAQPAQVATRAGAGTMIVVPMALQQAAWQAQLYQLAYERAVADFGFARHFARFFSVWN